MSNFSGLPARGSSFYSIVIVSSSLFLTKTSKIDYDAETKTKNHGPKATKIEHVGKVISRNSSKFQIGCLE